MNTLDTEINKYFRRVGVSVFADLKFLFSDSTPTITSETIHQESLALKASICDSDELEFGGCIASELTFEVSEADADLKGKVFTAWIGVVGQNEEYLGNINNTLGEFIVDDVEMVDGKNYKRVTAYDRMYIAAQTDVSEWYNNVFPKSINTTTDANGNVIEETVYGAVTLKEFKNSLLDHLGMKYYSKELPNDYMIVEKTLNVSSGLTGQTLLKMISVLQGGFGKISNSGYFEIINLQESESLEILDISDTDEYSEYMELALAEYTCKPITCLKFATDEGDEGCVVGTDTSNPYVISGNYLLYGKSATELTAIGSNILANFQFEYRPIVAKLKGFPYAQTGHKVVFNNTTNGEKVESFIFTRELSGIQSMIDNFTAKGNEYRVNEVTPSTIIEQIKSKTLKIEKSVDKVSTEISDLEKKTTSLIEQTVDEIVLKVDNDGNIVQVALGVDANKGTNYFQVGADNIDLEADEAINLLAGGDLNLTGKKIKITSDNFNVDMEGTVSIKNGKLYISNDNAYVSIDPGKENLFEIGLITSEDTEGDKVFYINKDGKLYVKGDIEALTGKIGGWNIRDNWLYGDDGVGISWSRGLHNFGVNGDNLEMSVDGALKIRLNSHGDNINDGGNNCLVAYVGFVWLSAGKGNILMEGQDININPKNKAYVNGDEILTRGKIKEKTNLNIHCDSEQKINTIGVTYSDGTEETLNVEWDRNNNVTKIGNTVINWEFEGVG